MRRIIASLDVGSNTIKLVVGEIFKKKLNIIAAVDVPSRGIKKGYVINPESATEAIKDLFDKVEHVIGLKVQKVIVNIPAFNTDCFINEGKVIIDGEDKIITSADIVKCMNSATERVIQPNMLLVSALPTVFRVNGETTKNPLNIVSDKLEGKFVIVTVPKKNLNGIGYCLQKIGVEVVDVCISPLGDYNEFKEDRYNKEIGAVVNIGDSITTVSIFNKGVLTACDVLEIGGSNIDNDLAYVYKLTKNDAKMIKEKLALAHDRMAQPNESIVLTDRLGERVKINQYNVSEIVKSRIEEMLKLIKKQINHLTKKEISYIIFSGGLTEIDDFDIVMDEICGPISSLKTVSEIGVRDNKYSVSVGTIKYYNQRLKLKNRDFSIFSIDDQEDLSGLTKKTNINEGSILGKLFSYFFDN